MKIAQWETAFFILMFAGPGDEGQKNSYVTYIEQGESTDLACDLKNSETINSLHWTHKRNPDSMERNIGELTSVSKEKNYEVISAFKIESFKLKVSNMQPYMKGHYTCYANNVYISEHSLYMSDSCAFTKCTKSAKEGTLFLKVFTPSIDLQHDFAGVDVVVECNGTTTNICDINFPEFNTTKMTKCELVSKSLSPYVIIVPNGEVYYNCDVFVTLVPSSHCPSKYLTKKFKAEAEDPSPGEASLPSKEPISTKKPEPPTTAKGQTPEKASSKEPVSTKVLTPFTSAHSKSPPTTMTATRKRSQKSRKVLTTTISLEEETTKKSLKRTTPQNPQSMTSYIKTEPSQPSTENNSNTVWFSIVIVIVIVIVSVLVSVLVLCFYGTCLESHT